MGDKLQRKREAPVKFLWYGKHAYRPLEEVIDKWPDYFIWCVERFQDVTPAQADYFKQKYGMELPTEVIAPVGVEPYEHRKDSPENEYEQCCKNYVQKYWLDELQ